eukprot:g26627.t1
MSVVTENEIPKSGLSPATADAAAPIPWLFSPALDLAAFLGSAAIALGALAVGYRLDWLHGDTPGWTWITAILLVDVAHVYATAFRVYFNRAEFLRRRWLYVVTPLLTFLIGAALYSEGEVLFWRVLAYLAVFHFVRQQYGWVAMYRAKGGESPGPGKWIDTAAIYLATVYPLIYWHSHLPRNFWWFLKGDFAELPEFVATIVAPCYWAAMVAYAGRSLYRGWMLGRWNPGKDIVVATTAVCWHVGIITFNSDYAFTVTNVIIHGVPYIVLIYWFHIRRGSEGESKPGKINRVFLFLATLWLFAYIEELFWHRGNGNLESQTREWLFGSGWNLDAYAGVLIPLLAVPQARSVMRAFRLTFPSTLLWASQPE